MTLGFLLTTSPDVALTQLTIQLEKDFIIPPNSQTAYQDYSAVGYILRGCESGGILSRVETVNLVHWLMVLLIIELEVSPYNGRLQKNVPNIQDAYLPIVRDLVRTKPLVTSVANRA